MQQQKKQIVKGDRIAQLILEKIECPQPVEVEELDKTERAEGGFGSTGEALMSAVDVKKTAQVEEKGLASRGCVSLAPGLLVGWLKLGIIMLCIEGVQGRKPSACDMARVAGSAWWSGWLLKICPQLLMVLLCMLMVFIMLLLAFWGMWGMKCLWDVGIVGTCGYIWV